MKVLIIDDARFQRSQLARALKELGHEVLEAVNGQEGYLRLCQDGPDVVFCDLLMPVLDGFGFLSMVQKHEIATPVVMLTADIQHTSKEQCLALGAKAFLNKPFQLEELKAALAACQPGGPA